MKKFLDFSLIGGIFLLVISAILALTLRANAQVEVESAASSTESVFYLSRIVYTEQDYIDRINYLERLLSKYAKRLDSCVARTPNIRTRN